MKVEQIREIAKRHGIKPGKMTKADLVRAIQAAESNQQCYDTDFSSACGQDKCLWREDCD